MTIRFTATLCSNDQEIEEKGDDFDIELPGMNQVCPECDGTGFVMNPSMRNHAYSAEEWNDEIPESQRDIMARGGRSIFHQDCPTCQGRNVVVVPDRKMIRQYGTEQQKQYLSRWIEQEASRRRDAREWANEIQMQERMGGVG